MIHVNEVSCIRRAERADAAKQIIGIGGRNEDGAIWKLSQHEAIAAIERRGWAFGTRQGCELVRLAVATNPGGGCTSR
jgi:hypothetical protein